MSSPAQPDLAAIAAKYGGVPADSDFFRYPPNVQTLARQLVDYKIPLPAGFALARPNSPWNAAIQAASTLDPTFDATQYNARLALRRDFTSGKSADNLRSLNTVIGHINDLTEKADALHNRSVPIWNTVANTALTATGDPRATNFDMARSAVSREMTRLFRGTGGAEADIQEWNKLINSSESPEQLKGAVDTALKLMASRSAALADQYAKGMGKPKDFHFLNDKSKEILRKLQYDPDSIERGELQKIDQSQSAAPAQDLSKVSTDELMRRLTGGK